MERKKSFGYKGKSSFGDKSKPSSYGRSSSSSRDGEKKSFGYKGKSSFGDKSKPLVTEDLVHHQEMERKKVSVTKENLVLATRSKPSGFTNNPKYFGKKPSESSSTSQEKESSILRVKKSLKAEVIDLKALLLKNIVKKEAKSKIF